MIPIVGRLPFALARLFGVPGQGPDVVDGTIYPTVDVDSSRPENAYIQGERLYAGCYQIAAGAGTRSGIAVTVNSAPAGNNMVTVVEAIDFYVGVATTVEIFCGSLAPLATALFLGARDTRLLSPGPSLSPTTFTGSNAVAASPSAQKISQHQLGAGAVLEIRQPIILAPHPTTLATVHGIQVLTASNNVNITATVWVRERPLAAGELVV